VQAFRLSRMSSDGAMQSLDAGAEQHRKVVYGREQERFRRGSDDRAVLFLRG